MEEIKETIFLAVSLFIIAGVLFIASLAIDVRSEIAYAYNSENQSQAVMEEYRKFNMYNGGDCTGSTCKQHINGDMVVSLIREYYTDTEIDIYIDRDSNGDSLRVNYKLAKADPSLVSLDNLQYEFDSDEMYHPYLVYNGIDPSEVDSKQETSQFSKVTGISLVRID